MERLKTLGAGISSMIWSSASPQVSMQQPEIFTLEAPRHVLSCDGGGMRGLFTLRVLQEIENKLPDHNLRNHTDLLVGTSTGSIIAGGLAYSDRPLQDLVDMYYKDGSKIFYRTTFEEIETLDGMIGPKYDPSQFDALLISQFGDVKISQLHHPALIYATDETHETVKIFDSYKARKNPETNYNVMLRYAIECSTAAPSYFPAMEFGTEALCDGGLIANNPSYSCLSSIKYHFGGQSLDSVKMVSVGTGYFPSGISFEEGKSMGFTQLLRHADLLFKGPMNASTKFAKEFLGEDNFIRLNGPLPKEISLDDYSLESLTVIDTAAFEYIKQNSKDIDIAVKMLLS